MIPDVQKLINQSGNVSVDIFNTRLIKPPTSVLIFPLKVKQHIFGVVFCMSSVQTDFSDVSPKVREVCDIMSYHLMSLLSTSLAADYRVSRVWGGWGEGLIGLGLGFLEGSPRLAALWYF